MRFIRDEAELRVAAEGLLREASSTEAGAGLLWRGSPLTHTVVLRALREDVRLLEDARASLAARPGDELEREAEAQAALRASIALRRTPCLEDVMDCLITYVQFDFQWPGASCQALRAAWASEVLRLAWEQRMAG